MVSNIYDGNIHNSLSLAYSIEMFHNFTLVHDDMMDNADLRRSHPTVHMKYGTNSAILSGDLMMMKSYQYLVNSCDDHEVRLKLLRLFTDTAIKVCEGQQYDMDFENSTQASISDYIRMIELKTAVLLAGSFKSGAIIGNAEDHDADHFYNYGLNLGLAFQIQDDFLDIYGDPDVFGKRRGGDILQKKKTFLYLRAMELVEDKAGLASIYDDDMIPPDEKIDKITAIYDTLNIKKYTEERINYYSQQAQTHLSRISIPRSRLSEILKFEKMLLERKQ
jgi:geranylgeranyl diphosphate synthase type II